MFKAAFADVLLYNNWRNPQTGEEEWHPTLLRQVHWHSRQTSATEAHGLKGAKRVQIRIPKDAFCGKEFTNPEAYDSPETQYCLQVGSRIVKLEGGTAPPTLPPALPLPPLCGEGTCTITAYRDNRGGLLPHLFVEGV